MSVLKSIDVESFSRSVVTDLITFNRQFDYILRSVDRLIKVELQKIFSNTKVEIPCEHSKHEITFTNVSLQHTTIRDHNGLQVPDTIEYCVNTGRTFTKSIFCDVTLTSTFDSKKVEIFQHKAFNLMKLPLCVKSFYNHRDEVNDNSINSIGGAFCINGIFKCVTSQLTLAKNRMFVFDDKLQFILECRSLRDTTIWSSTSTLQLKIKKDVNKNNIFLNIPFFQVSKTKLYDIPLIHCVIFCGYNKHEALQHCQYARVKQLLASTWKEPTTQCDLNEIYKKRIKKTSPLSVFHYQFAPHTETFDDGKKDETERRVYKDLKKLQFLFSAVNKLLMVKDGTIPCDSRDSMQSKSVQPAGDLLGILVRQIFRSFIMDIKNKITKFSYQQKDASVNAILLGILRSQAFNSRILSAFTSGNLSLFSQTKRYFKAQDMYNYPSSTQQYSQIVLDIHKESKNKSCRLLAVDAKGFLCSVSTSDGEQCGITNFLGMTTIVSSRYDVSVCIDLIFQKITQKDEHFVQKICPPPNSIRESYTVFLNGIYLLSCCTKYVKEFLNLIKYLRRRNDLPNQLSIGCVHELNEIHMYCDGGRLLRPVFIIDNLYKIPFLLRSGTAKVDRFDLLLNNGVIEYLDAFESRCCTIANSLHDVVEQPNYYTHSGLHDCTTFSISAATIPFSNNNAAARCTLFSGSQYKSIIGQYTKRSYIDNSTTIQYGTLYTQKPVSRTFVEEYLSDQDYRHTFPCFNAVTLIAAQGQNIEDSIILNKASLERGMFDYIKEIPIKFSYTLNEDDVIILNPQHIQNNLFNKIYNQHYDKIQANGLPKEGTWIEKGDVVLGVVSKQVQIKNNFELECLWRDQSVISKFSGRVKEVIQRATKSIVSIIIVLTSKHRVQVGDKLVTRHGQKGTVGAIYPQIDMPFNDKTGYVDVIFNPHGYPSRMTIGQIYESSAGKAALMKGEFFDATPFQRGNTLQKIKDLLTEVNMHSSGTEVFYNGKTGQRFQERLYCGVIAYSLMKHFVKDKYQARASTGIIDPITGQPVGGRKRNGGQRFGEMERDALLGHGSAAMMQSISHLSSDGIELLHCSQCNNIHNLTMCNVCGSKNFTKIQSTQASNLLFNAFKSLNIQAKFKK